MMSVTRSLRPRVIPVLLLDGERLIKTSKFQNPVYVGDPMNAVRIFNEKCVDEIIISDIHATSKRKQPSFDFIRELAGECFMPLCYSGGVHSFEVAQRLFSSGVEKICLTSAAIDTPELITQITGEYGAQSIVVGIDVKKTWLGGTELIGNGVTKKLKKAPEVFAKEMVERGAGEILLTSVDREGTGEGFDLDLIKKVSNAVEVPVIAHGGAGKVEDIQLALSAGASAVAAGSMFVFYGKHRAVLISYPNESDIDSLRMG